VIKKFIQLLVIPFREKITDILEKKSNIDINYAKSLEIVYENDYIYKVKRYFDIIKKNNFIILNEEAPWAGYMEIEIMG